MCQVGLQIFLDFISLELFGKSVIQSAMHVDLGTRSYLLAEDWCESIQRLMVADCSYVRTYTYCVLALSFRRYFATTY